MALDEIYRVKLTQAYNLTSPLSLNVFYYKQIFDLPPTISSESLANEFEANVEPLIRAIQSALVSTLQIAVENIIPGPDNFYKNYSPGARAGLKAGDCLPPYACWAFRYNRDNSAVRNGQKRFMGVVEGDQVNGLAQAAMTPDFTALGTRLGQILGIIGAADSFQPRIFRAGSPGKVIPSKVIAAKVQDDFNVSSVAYVSLSTQTSRKFGAGT